MAKELTLADKLERLRVRYASTRCVCGRPKQVRKAFCAQDMQVLGGSLLAPRPKLSWSLSEPETLEAWEACLQVLKDEGYVREGSTL